MLTADCNIADVMKNKNTLTHMTAVQLAGLHMIDEACSEQLFPILINLFILSLINLVYKMPITSF